MARGIMWHNANKKNPPQIYFECFIFWLCLGFIFSAIEVSHWRECFLILTHVNHFGQGQNKNNCFFKDWCVEGWSWLCHTQPPPLFCLWLIFFRCVTYDIWDCCGRLLGTWPPVSALVRGGADGSTRCCLRSNRTVPAITSVSQQQKSPLQHQETFVDKSVAFDKKKKVTKTIWKVARFHK